MCCFCCFAKDFGSLDRQDLATFSGPGDTEDTRGSGVHLERLVFIGERKEESNSMAGLFTWMFTRTTTAT